MYESKRKSINWKELGIKVILLAIGLFVVYLLVPKFDLSPFYDRIFNENVGIMERAAMAHYTIDRMPEHIGESHRMTLQEMLNAKMILPFVDKDGKFCDGEKSFVEITKIDDQLFTLKVQLSCGARTDFIIRSIGCYDVCRIVALEYELRRPREGFRYVCPRGYVRNGNQCHRTGTTRTPATPIKGNNRVVITDALRRDGETITQTAQPNQNTTPGRHTCSAGLTLSGDRCIASSSSSVPATPQTTTQTQAATAHTSTQTQAATASSSTQTQNAGLSAWRFVTSYRRTSPMTTYTRTLERLVANGTTSEFTCGNPINCPVRQTFWHYRYYQRSYTCPAGWSLSGSTCRQTTTTHSCPAGWNRNGTTCTRPVTTHSCPVGWSLSGSTCLRNVTTHVCPAGLTLSGTTCIASTSTNVPATWVPGTTTWSCPAGFTQSGTGANTRCTRTSTGEGEWYCADGEAILFNTNKCATNIKGGIIRYECPDKRDVLKGEWCYRTTTTGTIPATRQATRTWEYKWDRNRNLEGWEPTGKSRPVNGQPSCNNSNNIHIPNNNSSNNLK